MLHIIARELVNAGGSPYYVGGCVRDRLLGLIPKDFDIEVFGVSSETLESVLSRFGTVNRVGASFGVMKLRLADGSEMDFSIPRRDNKVSGGHRGFIVECDPTMTVRDAARRRDFTINAIYQHAVTGEIIDPFDGKHHLEHGVLEMVDVEHFREDPLRVLRAMQFAARFNMKVELFTAIACGEMSGTYHELPKERVWGEWYKWATKGDCPSYGLVALRWMHWWHHYPQLVELFGVEQNPEHHPEGDVWRHTLLVCNAAAKIANREGLKNEDRAVLLFAALCHDMGKPSTTVFERGAWRSPGHDQASVPLARQFLESIGCYERIIERVLPLVREHMFPTWTPITRRMVRRLKTRLGPATIEELLMVMEADYSGRPPKPAGLPEGAQQLIELNKELPPKILPLVSGLDIIEVFGVMGKEIGVIKAAAFEAQLDEEFTTREAGVEWLRANRERFACYRTSTSPSRPS